VLEKCLKSEDPNLIKYLLKSKIPNLLKQIAAKSTSSDYVKMLFKEGNAFQLNNPDEING